MPDLLDSDIAEYLKVAGGTVALHRHQGMVDAAHSAGMIVTVQTASLVQPYEDWRRTRGIMTIVRIWDYQPPELRSADITVDHAGAEPVQVDDDDAIMTRIAEQVAATQPAVTVERPTVPELGSDPVANIRRLFDLTYLDLASLFNISERHAHRWQSRGVPADRRRDVDALQAIGLTIVGGIGPAGARAWLRAGDPSGEDLVRTGRFDELAQRAESEKDSPFT